MATAIRRQILTEDRIHPNDCSGEQTSKVITWRQCSLAFSEVRAQPQELVAEIYGFRRITVSQNGTLVYHQKLLEIFSSQDGVSTFAAGVVRLLSTDITVTWLEDICSRVRIRDVCGKNQPPEMTRNGARHKNAT